VSPRAWTSKPPSASLPSATGAKPSCSTNFAARAAALSSSLDRNRTRRPPSTFGSSAKVSAGKWLKAFTSFAPGKARDITTEEGRLPNSSGETPYAFVTSITILPCQLLAAIAMSLYVPKGIANRMISALSASCSDFGMIVGPIAFATGSSASGGRLLAMATSILCGRTLWRAPGRFSGFPQFG
jgi:hypothetical protein